MATGSAGVTCASSSAEASRAMTTRNGVFDLSGEGARRAERRTDRLHQQLVLVLCHGHHAFDAQQPLAQQPGEIVQPGRKIVPCRRRVQRTSNTAMRGCARPATSGNTAAAGGRRGKCCNDAGAAVVEIDDIGQRIDAAAPVAPAAATCAGEARSRLVSTRACAPAHCAAASSNPARRRPNAGNRTWRPRSPAGAARPGSASATQDRAGFGQSAGLQHDAAQRRCRCCSNKLLDRRGEVAAKRAAHAAIGQHRHRAGRRCFPRGSRRPARSHRLR